MNYSNSEWRKESNLTSNRTPKASRTVLTNFGVLLANIELSSMTGGGGVVVVGGTVVVDLLVPNTFIIIFW